MDNALRSIQAVMKQQQRGRMWRPPKPLRDSILTWVASAQARGQTWREISQAVAVDKHRIKAWQRAAATPTTTKRVSAVPVQVAPPLAGSQVTAIVLHGASMRDVAALLAAL